MKRTQRPVTELKCGEGFLVNSTSCPRLNRCDLLRLPEAITQSQSMQLDMLQVDQVLFLTQPHALLPSCFFHVPTRFQAHVSRGSSSYSSYSAAPASFQRVWCRYLRSRRNGEGHRRLVRI